MAKYDKSEVSFEHPAQGKDHCGACTHYLGGDKCAIVTGFVAPEDWCKEFESKNPLRGIRKS